MASRNNSKLIKKALEEDPSIYEYDSIYEELQEQKNTKLAEHKEADKAKKPKYADNMLRAGRKRELDKLIREERSQAKARRLEGDDFAEKDVFVTAAYRQKLEERNRRKEELARQDEIDERQLRRHRFGFAEVEQMTRARHEKTPKKDEKEKSRRV